MAITFLGATDLGLASGGPVNNIGYTMPVGINTILFVMTSRGNGTRSAITYNGVSMTQITSANLSGSGLYDVWYLINPSSGANTLSLSNNTTQAVAAIAYAGVSQTAPINAFTNPTQTGGTSFTASVTSTVSNCWIVGILLDSTSATLSAGTGTTFRTNANSFLDNAWFDSNAAKAIGSNSLIGTATASNYAGIVIALAPVATNNSNFFEFM